MTKLNETEDRIAKLKEEISSLEKNYNDLKEKYKEEREQKIESKISGIKEEMKKMTPKQQVALAIMAARKVWEDKGWLEWTAWLLSGQVGPNNARFRFSKKSSCGQAAAQAATEIFSLINKVGYRSAKAIEYALYANPGIDLEALAEQARAAKPIELRRVDF